MSLDVRIAGFPGDGIGPEVYPHARRLFDAANKKGGFSQGDGFHLVDQPYNADWYLKHDHQAWPPGTPERLADEFDAAFMIALGDPRIGMAHARVLILDGLRGHKRWHTNLNVRPNTLIHPDLRPEIQQGPFDFILFQLDKSDEPIEEHSENAETEHETVYPKETHSLRAFKAKLRAAARHAKSIDEKRVMVVHKDNVFRNGHALWPRVFQQVQADEGIAIEEQLMDSLLERLVHDPESIPRVVVTDRAFGAVLTRAFEALRAGDRQPIPDDFDLTFGRENTEGMYFRGGEVKQERDDTVGTQIGKHTAQAIKANIIGTIAIARAKGLSSITVLHLNDVNPQVTQLWERIARQVADESSMQIDFMHAGDFVAEIIRNPAAMSQRVFAADNLLGDICGDAAAACVGGMGIPPTDQWNTDGTTRKHFFEPLHGSAPVIAGRGIANPTATLLTVGEVFWAHGLGMLRTAVHRALHDVIDSGIRTQDIPGGSHNTTTTNFADAVIQEFLRQA